MSIDNPAMADRFAIRELIDRYSYAVNERDWAAYESCFAEDAVWDVGPPFSFRLRGRSAILEIARTKISEEDFVVQTPHATVIWLDGDRARAHSTMREVVSGRGGATGLQMLGTYADQLMKSDGEWYFTSRVFRVTTAHLTAPAGDCYKEWTRR
jgi:ketosteroid isomerase-like protein